MFHTDTHRHTQTHTDFSFFLVSLDRAGRKKYEGRSEKKCGTSRTDEVRKCVDRNRERTEHVCRQKQRENRTHTQTHTHKCFTQTHTDTHRHTQTFPFS